MNLEKIVSTELKIPNENATVILGTVNKHNCTCFYINIGFWVTIPEFKRKRHVKIADLDDFSETPKNFLIRNFESKSKKILERNIRDIYPGYKYSFITPSINDTLNYIAASGFCSFEITVQLNQTIDWVKNIHLHNCIETFGLKIMEEINSIDSKLILNKHKPGFKKRGVYKGYKRPSYCNVKKIIPPISVLTS